MFIFYDILEFIASYLFLIMPLFWTFTIDGVNHTTRVDSGKKQRGTGLEWDEATHIMKFDSMKVRILDPDKLYSFQDGQYAKYYFSSPYYIHWGGYLYNTVEGPEHWEFDIVPDLHYINRFSARAWAGQTPRQVLQAVTDDTIFKDTFIEVYPGNIGSGWHQVGSYAKWAVTDALGHNDSKSLFSNYVLNLAESRLYREWPAQTTNPVELTFYFNIPTGTNSRALEFHLTDASGNYICRFYQDDSGNLLYYNGTFWQVISGLAVSYGVWEKVKIDVDQSAKTFTLYYNDTSYLSDGYENGSAGSFRRFYVLHNRTYGAVVEAYIDDVQINGDTPSDIPYTGVQHMDTDAGNLLDTIIGGLDTLNYTGKTQGDIVHDMAMIMNAKYASDNFGDFIIIRPVDKYLKVYTSNNIGSSSQSGIYWGNLKRYITAKKLDHVDTTSEINNNLKAASGEITESIAGGQLAYIEEREYDAFSYHEVGIKIYIDSVYVGYCVKVDYDKGLYKTKIMKPLFYPLT